MSLVITSSSVRRAKTTDAHRPHRARARPARASNASRSARAPRERRERVASFTFAVALASSFVYALGANADVVCSMLTPCTPPPPDGKPRYEMPGRINSPREDAEARYVAKLAAMKVERAPDVKAK